MQFLQRMQNSSTVRVLICFESVKDMTNSDANSFKNHEEIGKVYIAFTRSTLEKRSVVLKTHPGKISSMTFQPYCQLDKLSA